MAKNVRIFWLLPILWTFRITFKYKKCMVISFGHKKIFFFNGARLKKKCYLLTALGNRMFRITFEHKLIIVCCSWYQVQLLKDERQWCFHLHNKGQHEDACSESDADTRQTDYTRENKLLLHNATAHRDGLIFFNFKMLLFVL